jgi:hypothetical protein
MTCPASRMRGAPPRQARCQALLMASHVPRAWRARIQCGGPPWGLPVGARHRPRGAPTPAPQQCSSIQPFHRTCCRGQKLVEQLGRSDRFGTWVEPPFTRLRQCPNCILDCVGACRPSCRWGRFSPPAGSAASILDLSATSNPPPPCAPAFLRRCWLPRQHARAPRPANHSPQPACEPRPRPTRGASLAARPGHPYSSSITGWSSFYRLQTPGRLAPALAVAPHAMASLAPRAPPALAARLCAISVPMCAVRGVVALPRAAGWRLRPLLGTHRPCARPVLALPRPAGPSAAVPAMDAAVAPEEVVFGTAVEVLAPGAVDAGLFEADTSAAALLAELEAASAQLGDFLTTGAPLDLGAAGTWAGEQAGAGSMLPGENGMYNTTVRTAAGRERGVGPRCERATVDACPHSMQRQGRRAVTHACVAGQRCRCPGPGGAAAPQAPPALRSTPTPTMHRSPPPTGCRPAPDQGGRPDAPQGGQG